MNVKNGLREHKQGATVHRDRGLLKMILKVILLWYKQIATLAPSLDQPAESVEERGQKW